MNVWIDVSACSDSGVIARIYLDPDDEEMHDGTSLPMSKDYGCPAGRKPLG